MALTTSRIFVFRGRPPGRGGGISGSRTAHWASVRSEGYRLRFIHHYRQISPFWNRLSTWAGRLSHRTANGTSDFHLRLKTQTPEITVPAFAKVMEYINEHSTNAVCPAQ